MEPIWLLIQDRATVNKLSTRHQLAHPQHVFRSLNDWGRGLFHAKTVSSWSWISLSQLARPPETQVVKHSKFTLQTKLLSTFLSDMTHTHYPAFALGTKILSVRSLFGYDKEFLLHLRWTRQVDRRWILLISTKLMAGQYAGVNAGALRMDIKEDEQRQACSVDSDEHLNVDRQKVGREHHFSKRVMTEKQVSDCTAFKGDDRFDLARYLIWPWTTCNVCRHDIEFMPIILYLLRLHVIRVVFSTLGIHKNKWIPQRIITET